MGYYCEVCDKHINPKSKYRHFKSNNHNEIERCEKIKLSIENPDINDIDAIFCSYNIEHDKNYDYYLIKSQFILVSKISE